MMFRISRRAGLAAKQGLRVFSLWIVALQAVDAEESTDTNYSERVARLWSEGGSGAETDERVQRAIAEWVDRDGVGAVDQMGALEIDNRRFYGVDSSVREFALHRLALTDVDAALKSKNYRSLVSLKPGQRSRRVAFLSKLVLDRSPEQVLQMVRDQTFAGSDELWRQAGAALYHHHEDWHTWIQSLGNSEQWQRSSNRWELSRGIAKELLTDTPRGELYDVVEALAEKEEGELRKHRARRSPFSFSHQFRGLVTEHLVDTDLPYAMELAQKRDDFSLGSAIKRRLASEGKEALLDWRPEGRKLRTNLAARYLKPLLTGMAVPEAVDFLNGYETDDGAKSYVAWQEAEDLPKVIDQLLRLPKSAAREQLLREAFSLASEYEPGRVFEFAGRLPPNNRPAFIEKMATKFGRDDPVAFGRALAANAEHPLALRAGAKLAEGWGSYSSRTASRWVRSLAAGDLRDAAAAVLIDSLSDYDVESALKWALELKGRRARVDAIAKCLAGWMESDPSGAGAAAKGLGLEAAERAEVTRRMRDLKR